MGEYVTIIDVILTPVPRNRNFFTSFNVGVILKPLAVSSDDVIDWACAFFTSESTNQIIKSNTADRPYLISDLLALNKDGIDVWINKN